MYIPTIYLLFSAEIIFILIAFCTGLLIYTFKISANKNGTSDSLTDEELEDNFDLNTSYSEYIKLEVERNQDKLKQHTNNPDSNIEMDAESELDNEEIKDDTPLPSPAPSESQEQLLKIREMFLTAEKNAHNHQEHEINFWDSIYKGMADITDELTTVIDKQKSTNMDVEIHDKPEVQEKVFYIETQGKKVSGEVNKLKDIISDQENAINALRKSVNSAEGSELEQDIIDEINNQVSALEAQLNDSKMCMEILEMENNRLQEEIDQLDAQSLQLTESTVDNSENSTIDLSELQDLVDKQQSQINDLNTTIEGLEIDSELADKMKQTISEFAHSSQEMMGCISILEDENKHFKFQIEEMESIDDSLGEDISEDNTLDDDIDDLLENTSDDNELGELKSQLQNMEEEIIKKDVAYAQLQEEFESIEKEYLSMYEAMHGDNT